MTDYQFAAPLPWDHQRLAFELSRDSQYFALFMEQRTGKSRVIVDTAAYSFELGRIDGVLILAPNGVNRNWITESFAGFLPPRIKNTQLVWRSGKMATKSTQEALTDLLESKGLAILSMNYDALSTAAAKKYLGKYLRQRKLLIVADESDDLSTPSAKRTMTAIRAAKYGVMRRILTGTPAAESPFSLYSQTNFLQPGLLGFTSYLAFKHHHAKWEPGFNHTTNTAYETVARDETSGAPIYLNLDELQRKLSAFSFRCTRAECGGQLPVQSIRPFELAPAQRTIYNQLREEFRVELSGGAVTAAMVLVRYARLQQVASGFAILDADAQECPTCAASDPDCERCGGIGIILPPRQIIELPNPRLDALEHELRGTLGQTVIWTRFTRDADAVIARLEAMGRKPGRYDGQATNKQRDADKLAFQRGELTDIVASPQAGGRGLDFSSARTTIFYSHIYSLRLRLQAQDRVETLKRTDPAVIVDLCAIDTIDEPIIDCHRNKRAVQDAITGDNRRRWL